MLKYLLEKEFKQLKRNKFLPRLIVMFPLMVTLIIPLAASFEVKNIKLSLLDQDQSLSSRQLRDKILSSDYFKMTHIAQDYQDGLLAIRDDQADVVLQIPLDFEKSLIREEGAGIMVIANAVNGNKGGLGSAYLLRIISEYNQQIRVKMMGENGRFMSPFLQIVSKYRYNPSLLYHVFMVPALMVMVLAMVCGFLPALNIVGEKEAGTIEQMNVTPVSKFNFILAKLIPYWIIGFVVLTVCFIVAYLAWDLVPTGFVGTIYLMAVVFVFAFSGFGLVISNYAQSVQQAMFMMFFFVLTFIFMSGLYTPIANMPPWAQIISHLSPLKYIIQVLRSVYLKGSNFQDLQTEFAFLMAFATFFNTWAVLSYRKSG